MQNFLKGFVSVRQNKARGGLGFKLGFGLRGFGFVVFRCCAAAVCCCCSTAVTALSMLFEVASSTRLTQSPFEGKRQDAFRDRRPELSLKVLVAEFSDRRLPEWNGDKKEFDLGRKLLLSSRKFQPNVPRSLALKDFGSSCSSTRTSTAQTGGWCDRRRLGSSCRYLLEVAFEYGSHGSSLWCITVETESDSKSLDETGSSLSETCLTPPETKKHNARNFHFSSFFRSLENILNIKQIITTKY